MNHISNVKVHLKTRSGNVNILLYLTVGRTNLPSRVGSIPVFLRKPIAICDLGDQTSGFAHGGCLSDASDSDDGQSSARMKNSPSPMMAILLLD